MSYHNDLKAVEEYQASEEHERYVYCCFRCGGGCRKKGSEGWIRLLIRGNRLKNTYVLPLTEDLIRFDFQVDHEDEDLVGVLPMLANLGVGRN